MKDTVYIKFQGQSDWTELIKEGLERVYKISEAILYCEKNFSDKNYWLSKEEAKNEDIPEYSNY